MGNTQKDIYGVILLRTDRNDLIIEVDNIEKAYEKWAEYRDKWTTALHEKKPLVVVEKESEIITAFDPVMVYEIIIRKQNISLQSNADNPYKREMVENGFSRTFSKNTNSDLLDRGYKL